MYAAQGSGLAIPVLTRTQTSASGGRELTEQATHDDRCLRLLLGRAADLRERGQSPPQPVTVHPKVLEHPSSVPVCFAGGDAAIDPLDG